SCERSEQQDYHCFAWIAPLGIISPPPGGHIIPQSFSTFPRQACFKPDAKKNKTVVSAANNRIIIALQERLHARALVYR
ncbi:MAG: hypothetical protein JXA39_06720, partial [Bacteroidales bacterium]|nr:hypothetical protein [Bacteroidales bacterium]